MNPINKINKLTAGAILALPTICADALVGVDLIHAGSSVLTRF